MRKIYFLRAVLDLTFLFSVIGAVGLFIITPFLLLSSDWDIPIRINGLVNDLSSVVSKVLFIISVFTYFLFVYAIYLFKKTVNLFIGKRIFDDKVINNLSKIGKIFIAVTLTLNILDFIYSVLFLKKLDIETHLSFGFDSMLFNIAIGLFFIIMSEVFKMAKNIKEENDLTI